jgi:hypothetical protein
MIGVDNQQLTFFRLKDNKPTSQGTDGSREMLNFSHKISEKSSSFRVD